MPKKKSQQASDAAADWRPLSTKELEQVLQNETTFSEYLATLSVQQIDTYIAGLKSDTSMEQASRDSFIALLEHVRQDREQADKAAAFTLGPLVASVEAIDALTKQIETLEQIEQDMKSSS